MIISTEEMTLQMLEDLTEYHDLTPEEAEARVDDHAETVIDAMWDEYSHVMSEIIQGR